MKNKEISPGALRAAERIFKVFAQPFDGPIEIARIIDAETGLKEMIEALDEKITDVIMAGDKIEAVEFKSDPQLDKRLLAALSKAKGD